MKTITIEISDDAYLALSEVMLDPEDWLQNAAIARGHAAAAERSADPKWGEAAAALIVAGDDASDPVAILAKGLEEGLFKDAATRLVEQPPVLAAEPAITGTMISKDALWRRATDDEAEQMEAALQSQPVCLRRIYEGATFIGMRMNSTACSTLPWSNCSAESVLSSC